MPNNVIRSAKEVKLQDMIDHYEAISGIGVMDFSDYYDSRMDGIEEKDLQQSEELNAYVDQLLSFQKEADAGTLEEEELGLFDALKEKMLAEPQETGIHKMLQFKAMDALLKADGNLESEQLPKAAECQGLYDRITSFEIIEKNAMKRAMQDDGSYNKSPGKIAEEILAKEQGQAKQPLLQICNAMMQNSRQYQDILKSPAVTPYYTLLQEREHARKQAEKEAAMTPEQKEKQRLTQEIADRRKKQEKLQEELAKSSQLFDKEYKAARAEGALKLTVPSEKKKDVEVFKASAMREMQAAEKAELNAVFHDATDLLVRRIDAVKATDKGPVSDEFRDMMEGLMMLRNQKDTMRNIGDDKKSRNLSTLDAVASVYKKTKAYIDKREKDGFWGKHFGQGATRYKEAKEILDLLEQYHDAGAQLQVHYRQEVLVQRQEHKEALRDEIKSLEKEISTLTKQRDGEPKREDLSRSGASSRKKSAQKGTRQRLVNGLKDINSVSEQKKPAARAKKTEQKGKTESRKSVQQKPMQKKSDAAKGRSK